MVRQSLRELGIVVIADVQGNFTMKIETRIKQSEAHFRSGIKTDLILLVLMIFLYFFGPFWLVKACGVLLLLSIVVTWLEYWNAWRLKRRIGNEPAGK